MPRQYSGWNVLARFIREQNNLSWIKLGLPFFRNYGKSQTTLARLGLVGRAHAVRRRRLFKQRIRRAEDCPLYQFVTFSIIRQLESEQQRNKATKTDCEQQIGWRGALQPAG